ncbi:hypothetical protein AKO1_010908 [Acrasis kona]|uniref:RNase III domain-containing protein n=1 Tax=Acrasis kona TaxID=1008807 RepID=A0AAW2YRN9_9EUKA
MSKGNKNFFVYKIDLGKQETGTNEGSVVVLYPHRLYSPYFYSVDVKFTFKMHLSLTQDNLKKLDRIMHTLFKEISSVKPSTSIPTKMQLNTSGNNLYFIPISKQSKLVKQDEQEAIEEELKDGPYNDLQHFLKTLGLKAEQVEVPELIATSPDSTAPHWSSIATLIQNLIDHYQVLPELEEKIQTNYKNKFLLHRALSQSGQGGYSIDVSQNRRLHYLGDTILDVLVARHCVSKYYGFPYDQIKENKLYYCRNSTLEQMCIDNDWKLINYVPGHSRGKLDRKKVNADIIESLIATMYLEEPDMSLCERFCNTFLFEEPAPIDDKKKSKFVVSKVLGSEQRKFLLLLQEQLGIKFNDIDVLHNSVTIDPNADHRRNYGQELYYMMGESLVRYLITDHQVTDHPYATSACFHCARDCYLSGSFMVKMFDRLFPDKKFKMFYEKHKKGQSGFGAGVIANKESQGYQMSTNTRRMVFTSLLGAYYIDQNYSVEAMDHCDRIVKEYITSQDNPSYRVWDLVVAHFKAVPNITFSREFLPRGTAGAYFNVLFTGALPLAIAPSKIDCVSKAGKLLDIIEKYGDGETFTTAEQLEELWGKHSKGREKLFDPEDSLKLLAYSTPYTGTMGGLKRANANATLLSNINKKRKI